MKKRICERRHILFFFPQKTDWDFERTGVIIGRVEKAK